MIFHTLGQPVSWIAARDLDPASIFRRRSPDGPLGRSTKLLEKVMKTLKVPVDQTLVRRIDDPFSDANRFTYHALVRAVDLPANLPLDVNPRRQDLKSRVAREIRETLDQEPQHFHLLNRGITILCYNAHFEPKTRSLELTFPEVTDTLGMVVDDSDNGENGVPQDLDQYLGDKDYGVVDGGHSYQVVLTAAEEAKTQGGVALTKFSSAYVRLEVIVGVEDTLAISLARARNTSKQVEVFSLANMAGKFDWVKDRIASMPYAKLISYTENEGTVDNPKPINIKDVVRIMSALHPSSLDRKKSPIKSYSGSGSALKQYVEDEEKNEKLLIEGSQKVTGFKALKDILPSILDLYWEVKGTFEDVYGDVGGETAVKRRKEQGGEIEPVSGKSRGRAGSYEHFKARNPKDYVGNWNPKRLPPEAFVMPIVAGFRALIQIDQETGMARWKADPVEFYRTNRLKYIDSMLNLIEDYKKPNAVGKSSSVWEKFYLEVKDDAGAQ